MEINKIQFTLYDNINILENLVIDFKKGKYIYKYKSKLFPLYLNGINYALDMQKEVLNLEFEEFESNINNKDEIIKYIEEKKLVQKIEKYNRNEEFSNFTLSILLEDGKEIIFKSMYEYKDEVKELINIFLKYNEIFNRTEIDNETNKIYIKSISKILIQSLNLKDISIPILKKAYEIYLDSKAEIQYMGNSEYRCSLLAKDKTHFFDINILGGELNSLNFVNDYSKEEDFLAYIFLLNELDRGFLNDKSKEPLKDNKYNEKLKSKSWLDEIKKYIPFIKSQNKERINKEYIYNILSPALLSKGDKNQTIDDVFKGLNDSIDIEIEEKEQKYLLNFLSIYALILENNNIIKNVLIDQKVDDLIAHKLILEEKYNNILKDRKKNKNIPVNVNSLTFRTFTYDKYINIGDKKDGKVYDFNIYKIDDEIIKSETVNTLVKKKNLKEHQFPVILIDEDLDKNNKEDKKANKKVTIIGNVKLEDKYVLIGVKNKSSLEDLNTLQLYVYKIVLNMYKHLNLEELNLPDIFIIYILKTISEVNPKYLSKNLKDNKNTDTINELNEINNEKAEERFNIFKEFLNTNKSYAEYIWYNIYMKFKDNKDEEDTKSKNNIVNIKEGNTSNVNLNNLKHLNIDIDIYKDLVKDIEKINKQRNEENILNEHINSKRKKQEIITKSLDSLNIEEQIKISKYGRN